MSPPRLLATMRQETDMATPRLPHTLPRITERQWEVAELVALGYQNLDIAEQLGVSLAGAKYLVSELLRRLDLTRREEIARWYRAERLVRGEAIERAVFEPRRPTRDLVAMTEAQGWPLGMLDRALRLQVAFEQIERWLARSASVSELERWLDDHERMMFGTLRVRQATWLDNEALSDLYRHAPEAEGEWQVTFERGPNVFAQSRLQPHFHVQVVEDRGVLLGAVARAYPRLRVCGELMPFEFQAGFVVRSEARGWGVSRLISHVPRPASAWPAAATLYLVRQSNAGGHEWLRGKGRASALLARPSATRGETNGASPAPTSPPAAPVPGIPLTVHHLALRPELVDEPADDAGIRPAGPADLQACAALIEIARAGFDFTPPVTAQTLEERMAIAGAAPRDVFWPHVYSWGDLFVVERSGRIVACAGLWDAGRDLREVWRHPTLGRRVIEGTVVLDAGFAPGHERAFVRLLEHLARRSDELGRNRMTALLMPFPGVVERLDRFRVGTETRSLQFSIEERLDRALPAVRPLIDLAYW